MVRYIQRWFPLLLLSLFPGSVALPYSGSAQETLRELDRTQFGIGYIANAPDELGGVGGYFVIPKWGGIGLYLDYKWDLSSPADSEDFEGGLTAEDVPFEVPSAEFLERKSSYRGFNVALIRPVSAFLMVYGGVGLAEQTRFQSFQDPSGNLGRAGIFWVESPSTSENRVNILVGLMMRMGSRITSHFGFETQPSGVTAGVSLRIPKW